MVEPRELRDVAAQHVLLRRLTHAAEATARRRAFPPGALRETEWEGFEPSRRVDPAHAISSRAPSAARTPLPADPSIARGSVTATSWTFFPLVALFCNCDRLRPQVRSRSFPLAPSVSRSRLKLCRGTDAFRGNGTQAEWTKRQAFGHFVFRRGDHARCGCWSGIAASEGFSRCERYFAFESLALGGSVPLCSVSHRALSRKQTKLRRGVGSPSGPRHAGGAEDATESRSVHFVVRAFTC